MPRWCRVPAANGTPPNESCTEPPKLRDEFRPRHRVIFWPKQSAMSPRAAANGQPSSRSPRSCVLDTAWPVRYAEALVCTGDHVAAEDWLSTLEQQARAQRHRSRLAGIARIRGQLAAARRDHQKARAAFKLAIQLSEGINALEHASALLGYGRYLRRRGERRGAAGQLRNARQCAQALHATPLLDACDAELKAGGMEIHTTLNEPLHTLTPQERVVTGLIRAGKTNRQIATELVLSIKTIDYHINNVYHKLNVHSRSELIAKTVKDTAGL